MVREGAAASGTPKRIPEIPPSFSEMRTVPMGVSQKQQGCRAAGHERFLEPSAGHEAEQKKLPEQVGIWREAEGTCEQDQSPF